MKRFVAAIALVVVIASPSQAARGPGVTAEEAQEFQLGFALQSPSAQTEAFLKSVKSLKEITDDGESARAVGKLADQSRSLRDLEARAYAQVAQMLHAMGAPPKLQSWASNAVSLLSAPLVLSQEAKDSLRSDPHTAAVLGTIDEAQSVNAEADKQMPSLLTWLKLTHGRTGVWAAAAGNLVAGMDATVAQGGNLLLSPSEPIRLSDSAPAGTPASVLQALNALAPKRGNLAILIHLPPILWSAKQLVGPRDVLLQAYGSETIARVINQRQKP